MEVTLLQHQVPSPWLTVIKLRDNEVLEENMLPVYGVTLLMISMPHSTE